VGLIRQSKADPFPSRFRHPKISLSLFIKREMHMSVVNPGVLILLVAVPVALLFGVAILAIVIKAAARSENRQHHDEP
jgi:ABC-type sulfate transport system permease subunit